MGFAENLSKICARAADKAALVVRKTALDLQTMMVETSPVDTGRFKGNWQCGLGALNADTGSAPSKGGASSIDRTAGVLQAWVPGQAIWLTNSLPYAKRLEEGWSKQAPYGMVRLSVQRYSDALERAVKEMAA